MQAGESVSALARELKMTRKDLYAWRDRFQAGGPEALRGRGRQGAQSKLLSVVLD
jgi:transposase-like protein